MNEELEARSKPGAPAPGTRVSGQRRSGFVDLDSTDPINFTFEIEVVTGEEGQRIQMLWRRF
jgi:hypothetical protein